MSTVALILGAFLLALIILDRIPGVRHLISPVVSGTSSVLAVVVGSSAAWMAWAVKTFFHDHGTLFRNLFGRRRDIDPTDPYH